MNELVMVNIPDIHIGAKVLAPFILYETVLLEITSKIRRYPMKIDVIVISGDLFDTKFPEDSREVEVAKMFIEELSSLCEKLIIFRGTEGHDRDMLDILKPLTKYGDVYNHDTSKLETQLIAKVKSAKELVIAGKATDLEDGMKSLIRPLLEKMSVKSDNEVYIFEKPTFMTLNGYNVLFCPEVYDVDDVYLNSLFDKHPDIVFYHGMMEGAIEHYHDAKTALIYNRSITLRRENLKKVRYFIVGGHIHGRVSLDPFIPSKEMLGEKVGLRAWYTGNSYQSTFSDAGLHKGFDIIHIKNGIHKTTFMECTSGPKFIIHDMTKEFKHLNHIEVNNRIIKNLKEGDHIRIDIDTNAFSSDALNTITTMRAKFPNLKFKVFNSGEDASNEARIKSNHSALLSKPIKDMILELSEGKITEEDYKYFFEEE